MLSIVGRRNNRIRQNMVDTLKYGILCILRIAINRNRRNEDGAKVPYIQIPSVSIFVYKH